MSGTLPTTPIPASMDIRSYQPTRSSTTHNLKRVTRTTGAQRWGIKLTYPAMLRSAFMPLWSFIVKQDGQYGTFTLTLPSLTTPLGAWGGSPINVVAAAIGATTATFGGFSGTLTGAGKAGDFFKFSGHSKVYQLTDDLNIVGSPQEGSATFRPALVAAVAAGESITASAVPMTVGLVADTISFPANPGAIVPSFEIEMVEVY